jgi:virginiamycin B lyase
LWFTENAGKYIGVISTDGSTVNARTATQYNPTAITTSNGNLWFTESNNSGTSAAIGKIGTNGVITSEFQLPASASNPSPKAITTDSSNNIWFTEFGNKAIGKMDQNGTLTTYSLSSKYPSATPSGIVFGPDGNIWFTDPGTNSIGSIGTDGSNIVEYSLTGTNPLNIIAGSNRTLWFTEAGSDVIGEVQIPVASVAAASSSTSSSPASLSTKSTIKSPNTGFNIILNNQLSTLLVSLFTTIVILYLIRKYSLLSN